MLVDRNQQHSEIHGVYGKIADSRTYILLTKRSLLTPLPLLPLGFSVHISFTFSNTMLQCRSKALTRANSLRLLRQEIRT